MHRGLNQSNLYTLADYSTMWDCNSLEELAVVIDNDDQNPLTPEEHIAKLERMGYKVEIKEKEPGTTEPSKETVEPSTQIHNININKNIIKENKNQYTERYTLKQIQQLFGYDIMIHDNPYQKQDIDSVMNILHTTMNTYKATIKIAGQDKPAMAVIGKLMKLDKEIIMYAIEKYTEQTDRVKNPTAYMLTILYNAPEQYYLDKKNQANNETAQADRSHEENKQNYKNKENANGFSNFQQRKYDYDELEKMLLNR